MKTKVFWQIVVCLFAAFFGVLAASPSVAQSPESQYEIDENGSGQNGKGKNRLLDTALNHGDDVVRQLRNTEGKPNVVAGEAKAVGFARFSQWMKYARGNWKTAAGVFLVVLGLVLFFDYPLLGIIIVLSGVGIVVYANLNKGSKVPETDC